MITTVDDTDATYSPARQIGICSNPKGDGTLGSTQPCGVKILSDDIEAVEMESGQYICGRCVNDLLRDKTVSYSPLAR